MRKFLHLNGMNHVLRAHQLCMEGYSVLYGDQLSTVWSAPNYCYRCVCDFRRADVRCGNMASILEVSPGGKRFFNVFEAAPENEASPFHFSTDTADDAQRDGPNQQQASKVSLHDC